LKTKYLLLRLLSLEHFKCQEISQADLGIEVILKLFSKAGLRDLFKTAILDDAVSDNSKRFLLYRKNTSKRLIR
jgi:hypothetical protein